jgi:hypothetical protein
MAANGAERRPTAWIARAWIPPVRSLLLAAKRRDNEIKIAAIKIK